MSCSIAVRSFATSVGGRSRAHSRSQSHARSMSSRLGQASSRPLSSFPSSTSSCSQLQASIHPPRQSIKSSSSRLIFALNRNISTSTTRYLHSSTPRSNTDPNPTPSRICPSCSHSIPVASSPCPSCSRLIPIPSHLTHHSLLFLTPPSSSSTSASLSTSAEAEVAAREEISKLPGGGYDLDPRDLRTRMLSRQRDLHPDRHGGSELARDLSGRVNKAYEVLASPLRRAEYLLAVHGVPTLETDSVSDPDLLMEIMEAREQLEDATDSETIEAIRDQNHQRVEATVAELKSAFSSIPPDLDRARTLSIQLRYWIGLENAAKDKL